MIKRNRAVMRIMLLNQYMTVEASHLRNREYADAAEGTGRNRQYLTLCYIRTQIAVRITLQTVEGSPALLRSPEDGSESADT